MLFGNIENLNCNILNSYYLEFFAIYRTLATVLILGLALLWGLGRGFIEFEEFQIQSALIISFFFFTVGSLFVISFELRDKINEKCK